MTTPVHTCAFRCMPSALAGLVRAGVRRAPGLTPGGTVPAIRVSLPNVRPDPDRLAAYRAVCGFGDDGCLPVTYPHALAGPLHLAALTHPAFPFRLPGLVHVRKTVVQRRPLAANERVDLQVDLGGHREVEKGLEFDMTTAVTDGAGATVWSGVSTNLLRTGGGSGPGRRAGPDLADYRRGASWSAPVGIGWRYGRIAADLNPIHLHVLTARLFGMRRPIAHGMWLFAGSLAALGVQGGAGSICLDVAFRRPVPLPAQLQQWCRQDTDTDGMIYRVTDPTGDTLHLEGTVAAGAGAHGS